MDATTTVNAILLPRFDKQIKMAFHHGGSYRWDNIKRNGKRSWQGKGRYFEFTLYEQAEYGGGSRAEQGNMPTSDVEGYQAGRVFNTLHYRRIGITGLLAAAATGGDDSIADEKVQKTKNAVANMKADMARQMWQDGTGILCSINNAAGYAVGTSTFAVDAPGNWVDGAGTALTQGCRFLRVGMRVAIGQPNDLLGTSGTAPIYRKIASINRAGSTFTVTVALGAGETIANNALVVLGPGGTVNDNNSLREMWGVLGSVTNTTPALWGEFSAAAVAGFATGYAGIDTAAHPLFVSYVRHFSGSPQEFDSRLLPDALSFMKELNDDQQVVKLITWHPSMTSEYAATLEGDIRQVPRKQVGGYDMPVFTYGGEIPIEEEGHCPIGHILLDDPKTWELAILQDIGFKRFAGETWWEDDETDSARARLEFKGNCFLPERWKAGLIRDIRVTRAPAY